MQSSHYKELCLLPSPMPYGNTTKLRRYLSSHNPPSSIQHQEGKEHQDATTMNLAQVRSRDPL
jgi:hypothetical protein